MTRDGDPRVVYIGSVPVTYGPFLEDYKVEVSVYDTEKGSGNWPPRELAEFSAWLAQIIAEIPAEYRKCATIDFNATCDEGVYCEISYIRPGTEEEWQNAVRANHWFIPGLTGGWK